MVSVPSQYQALVDEAASGTGLPADVVAAQINEESGFNPTALSPTGAMGIFQFEPGTYTSEGGTAGTEDNPADEVNAYITFMKQLLAWSGGNVAKALAAYNAGQGNWQAGQGYANTILANAGASPGLQVSTTGTTAATTTAADTSDTSGGLFSIPADITAFFSDADKFVTLLLWLVNPASWVRIGAFIVGVALLLFAVHALIAVGEGEPLLPSVPKTMPIPVPV
jgi:hypothetical protein